MVDAQTCDVTVAQASVNRLQVREETHGVIFGKYVYAAFATVIFLI
jgi:hypothetical protein